MRARCSFSAILALLACFGVSRPLPAAEPPIAISLKADNASAHQNLDAAALAKLRPSLDLYVTPDPLAPGNYGPRNLPAWSFASSIEQLERLKQAGFPVIVTGSRSDNTTFSYLNPEPIVMEDDRLVTQTMNLFDPVAWGENLRMLRERVRQIEAKGGRIEAHALNIGSNWGETEYYIGTSILNWEQTPYSGYSPSERKSFQAWLQAAYGGDLGKLNHAWGTHLTAWAQAAPPKPVRGVRVGTFDGRADWLDFNQWRTQRLTEAVAEMAAAARSETQRPLDVLISFSHTKAAAGPDVGALAKRFSQFAPVYFHCTDAMSLAAVRYMDSVRRFYKIPTYLAENDGDRFLYHSTIKLMMCGLMGGATRIDYCAVYNLGVHGQGYYRAYPNDVYYLMREVGDLSLQLDMERPQSSIAFLNSALSRAVRAPLYQNLDVQGVYDEVLNQTHAVAGWGTALGYPDVIDEQLIADGRLQGLKLLIVPNTSVTLLPAAVQRRIAEWVRAGGWLVLTGPGALLHRQEDDHRLTAGDPRNGGDLAGGLLQGAAGAMPGASWKTDEQTTSTFVLAAPLLTRLHRADSTATTARLYANQWMEAPTAGGPGSEWEPLMVREPSTAPGQQQAAAWLQHVGQGGVLFCAAPVPEPHLFGWRKPINAQNIGFYQELFPLLLRELAQRIGADDFARSSGLRVAGLGTNRRDGRPTFMAFSLGTEHAPTRLEFPAALAGREVRLLIFGQHVARANWVGGKPLDFAQPGVEPFWKDPTNAVLDHQAPAMAPYADLRVAVPGAAEAARPTLEIHW